MRNNINNNRKATITTISNKQVQNKQTKNKNPQFLWWSILKIYFFIVYFFKLNIFSFVCNKKRNNKQPLYIKKNSWNKNWAKQSLYNFLLGRALYYLLFFLINNFILFFIITKKNSKNSYCFRFHYYFAVRYYKKKKK